MAKKSFYETASFKALQSKWYKKLEDSGFVDIEKGETDSVVKPEIISTKTAQYHVGDLYSNLCQNILATFKFKKEIHKVIFQLHANGLSEREIKETVQTERGITVSQKGINLLIKRVKEEHRKGGP